MAKTETQPQGQAQPTVQPQTTPPLAAGVGSQQAAQVMSSPTPPQRPARRKQAGQTPASPCKAASVQPPQQQTTQASGQTGVTEVSKKAADTVTVMIKDFTFFS